MMETLSLSIERTNAEIEAENDKSAPAAALAAAALAAAAGDDSDDDEVKVEDLDLGMESLRSSLYSSRIAGALEQSGQSPDATMQSTMNQSMHMPSMSAMPPSDPPTPDDHDKFIAVSSPQNSMDDSPGYRPFSPDGSSGISADVSGDAFAVRSFKANGTEGYASDGDGVGGRHRKPRGRSNSRYSV
jgi:hypothetical protein